MGGPIEFYRNKIWLVSVKLILQPQTFTDLKKKFFLALLPLFKIVLSHPVFGSKRQMLDF